VQGHARVVKWLYCVYVAGLQQAKHSSYDSALLAAARGVLHRLSGAYGEAC
jgi:hypothetical protein